MKQRGQRDTRTIKTRGNTDVIKGREDNKTQVVYMRKLT